MNLFLSCVMFSVKKVSFPTKTAVCVWGGAIGAKWPKSVWKLQNQHFWVKTVGVTWGRQVNFSAIGETLLTELHIFFTTKSTSFFSWIVCNFLASHCFCTSPLCIMYNEGGLNLKICQNFVGKNFFSNFWGDKPLWRELKLYQGGE